MAKSRPTSRGFWHRSDLTRSLNPWKVTCIPASFCPCFLVTFCNLFLTPTELFHEEIFIRLGSSQASEYGGALLGVHVGPDGSISNPVQFNLSDFAGGAGLEQLLDQLAQQHQPAADPANRAVVEALPKLEVAPLVGEFQSLCTFP